MKITENELRSAIRKSLVDEYGGRKRRIESRGRNLIEAIATRDPLTLKTYNSLNRRFVQEDFQNSGTLLLESATVGWFGRLIGFMKRTATKAANRARIDSMARFIYGGRLPADRGGDQVQGLIQGFFSGYGGATSGQSRGLAGMAAAGGAARSAMARRWWRNLVDSGEVVPFNARGYDLTARGGSAVENALSTIRGWDGSSIASRNVGAAVDANGQYLRVPLNIKFQPPGGGAPINRNVEVYQLVDMTSNSPLPPGATSRQRLYLPAGDSAQNPSLWRSWGTMDEVSANSARTGATGLDDTSDLVFVRTRSAGMLQAPTQFAGATSTPGVGKAGDIVLDVLILEFLLNCADVPILEEWNIYTALKGVVTGVPPKLKAALYPDLSEVVAQWNVEMESNFGGRDLQNKMSLGYGGGPQPEAFHAALDNAASPDWIPSIGLITGTGDSREITEDDILSWKDGVGDNEITILENQFVGTTIAHLSSTWADANETQANRIRSAFEFAWEETQFDLENLWAGSVNTALELIPGLDADTSKWGTRIMNIVTSENTDAFQRLQRTIKDTPICMAYVMGEQYAIDGLGIDLSDPAGTRGTLFSDALSHMGNPNNPDTFLGWLQANFNISQQEPYQGAPSGENLQGDELEAAVVDMRQAGSDRPGSPVDMARDRQAEVPLAENEPSLNFQAAFNADSIQQALVKCGRRSSSSRIDSLTSAYMAIVDTAGVERALNTALGDIAFSYPASEGSEETREFPVTGRDLIAAIRRSMTTRQLPSADSYNSRAIQKILQTGFNQLVNCEGESLGNGNPWVRMSQLMEKYACDCAALPSQDSESNE